MASYRWAFFYGFLLWMIPFVVALLIFSIRESQRPLFESIMPVVLAVTCVVFFNLYFWRVEDNFIREGVVLGLLWLAISVGLDLLMFMQGPMQMSLADYVMDIGLTYLIYPAITVGLAYAVARRAQPVRAA